MTNETSRGRLRAPDNSGEAGSFQDDDGRQRQSRTTRKLQLLSAGPHLLGIFEDEIAAIAQWRRPTPLPHAPPAVLGVVSIQGRMLTVLDPLNLFGETRGLGFPSGLLVALRGDEQIALAIENTGDTLDLAITDIHSPSEPTNSAIAGTLHVRDQLVNVIHVKGLFPAALRGRDRRRRRF